MYQRFWTGKSLASKRGWCLTHRVSSCCPTSCKLQCELFSLRHERWYLVGTVDPCPEIPIGEEVVAQHGDKVRERPAEAGAERQILEKKKGDQCRPYLDHDRIGGGTDEGLYPQVLLDRLEEDLDLPAVFVDGSDGGGTEGQMVGDEDDALFLRLIPYLDTSQGVRIVLLRVIDVEGDELILQDGPV